MKLLFPFTLNRNSKQATGLIFWGAGGHGSGNLFDFSGQFDNGQINGSVIKWVTGVDGGQTAISYDGSTSRTALVSSNPFPVSTGISVACWVKTSTTARYQYLMVRWGVAGGSDSWHLRLDQTTGFVYWNISSSGSYQAGNDLNGTTNVADGKWHLVVATYDGVNEKIYVDGQLQATLAVTGTIFQTSNTVSFGGLSDGSTSSNWLLGSMDDPRIWNYALPANVIKEMYQPAARWQLRYRPKNHTFIRSGAVTPESASNTLTITQSLKKSLFHTFSQSLTIAQNVLEVGDELASNTLTITQSVVVKQPNQKVSQSLSIAETLDRSGSVFHHSASNTLSIIQSNAALKYKPFTVSQSLTITQTPAYLQSKGLSNSLTITQSLVKAYEPHSESPPQSLTLVSTVAAQLIRSPSPTQTLTVSQTVANRKILSRTISQPLVVIHTAVPRKFTGLAQSLTITQTVVRSVQRNKSVAQSLTLSHSVSVALNLRRTLTSTLVLAREHEIPDGTGGFVIIPNLIYTKGGIGGGPCCPVFGRSTTIVGAFSTIVLPNPELGDAEAPISAIKILRTVTGNIYTYARTNRSRKLKYKFLISRKKAYELRKFLLQNLTKRVTMTNWKGEIWFVNFLTDPVELVADKHGEPPCGELYSIELDFEGIRIN